MTRASRIEYDAWNALQTDGLEDWSWDSIYPYQLKAETFTPPTEEVANATSATWDASNHGTGGPIHYSYPEFGFPQISLWSPTLQNLNVSVREDAYGGETLGISGMSCYSSPSLATAS